MIKTFRTIQCNLEPNLFIISQVTNLQQPTIADNQHFDYKTFVHGKKHNQKSEN